MVNTVHIETTHVLWFDLIHTHHPTDMSCIDNTTTRDVISSLKRRIHALEEENRELQGTEKSANSKS